MRLLDLISQGYCARVQLEEGHELPGAGGFQKAIRDCPSRYVLSDDLVHCATHLSYAEGDRLSACLDLIRVPATSLWVEWSDEPRREALRAIPGLKMEIGPVARRAGALITAALSGRSGEMRTFWSTPDEIAYLSPLVISFDLDRAPQAASSRDGSAYPGTVGLRMEGEPAIQELLEHLLFRFDEAWAAYYRSCWHTDELRTTVLRANLAGCAFDAPMLLAFFLLLNARSLLPKRQVLHERLNMARRRAGKSRLLEHVEVSAPLDAGGLSGLPVMADPTRIGPRLHHVRGHLVRRGLSIFWRSPHLRGSARLGLVRTRTVELSFSQR
jgi:hypothetical protein